MFDNPVAGLVAGVAIFLGYCLYVSENRRRHHRKLRRKENSDVEEHPVSHLEQQHLEKGYEKPLLIVSSSRQSCEKSVELEKSKPKEEDQEKTLTPGEKEPSKASKISLESNEKSDKISEHEGILDKEVKTSWEDNEKTEELSAKGSKAGEKIGGKERSTTSTESHEVGETSKKASLAPSETISKHDEKVEEKERSMTSTKSQKVDETSKKASLAPSALIEEKERSMTSTKSQKVDETSKKASLAPSALIEEKERSMTSTKSQKVDETSKKASLAPSELIEEKERSMTSTESLKVDGTFERSSKQEGGEIERTESLRVSAAKSSKSSKGSENNVPAHPERTIEDGEKIEEKNSSITSIKKSESGERSEKRSLTNSKTAEGETTVEKEVKVSLKDSEKGESETDRLDLSKRDSKSEENMLEKHSSLRFSKQLSQKSIALPIMSYATEEEKVLSERASEDKKKSDEQASKKNSSSLKKCNMADIVVTDSDQPSQAPTTPLEKSSITFYSKCSKHEKKVEEVLRSSQVNVEPENKDRLKTNEIDEILSRPSCTKSSPSVDAMQPTATIAKREDPELIAFLFKVIVLKLCEDEKKDLLKLLQEVGQVKEKRESLKRISVMLIDAAEKSGNSISEDQMKRLSTISAVDIARLSEHLTDLKTSLVKKSETLLEPTVISAEVPMEEVARKTIAEAPTESPKRNEEVIEKVSGQTIAETEILADKESIEKSKELSEESLEQISKEESIIRENDELPIKWTKDSESKEPSPAVSIKGSTTMKILSEEGKETLQEVEEEVKVAENYEENEPDEEKIKKFLQDKSPMMETELSSRAERPPEKPETSPEKRETSRKGSQASGESKLSSIKGIFSFSKKKYKDSQKLSNESVTSKAKKSDANFKEPLIKLEEEPVEVSEKDKTKPDVELTSELIESIKQSVESIKFLTEQVQEQKAVRAANATTISKTTETEDASVKSVKENKPLQTISTKQEDLSDATQKEALQYLAEKLEQSRESLVQKQEPEKPDAKVSVLQIDKISDKGKLEEVKASRESISKRKSSSKKDEETAESKRSDITPEARTLEDASSVRRPSEKKPSVENTKNLEISISQEKTLEESPIWEQKLSAVIDKEEEILSKRSKETTQESKSASEDVRKETLEKVYTNVDKTLEHKQSRESSKGNEGTAKNSEISVAISHKRTSGKLSTWEKTPEQKFSEEIATRNKKSVSESKSYDAVSRKEQSIESNELFNVKMQEEKTTEEKDAAKSIQNTHAEEGSQKSVKEEESLQTISKNHESLSEATQKETLEHLPKKLVESEESLVQSQGSKKSGNKTLLKVSQLKNINVSRIGTLEDDKVPHKKFPEQQRQSEGDEKAPESKASKISSIEKPLDGKTSEYQVTLDYSKGNEAIANRSQYPVKSSSFHKESLDEVPMAENEKSLDQENREQSKTSIFPEETQGEIAKMSSGKLHERQHLSDGNEKASESKGARKMSTDKEKTMDGKQFGHRPSVNISEKSDATAREIRAPAEFEVPISSKETLEEKTEVLSEGLYERQRLSNGDEKASESKGTRKMSTDKEKTMDRKQFGRRPSVNTSKKSDATAKEIKAPTDIKTPVSRKGQFEVSTTTIKKEAASSNRGSKASAKELKKSVAQNEISEGVIIGSGTLKKSFEESLKRGGALSSREFTDNNLVKAKKGSAKSLIKTSGSARQIKTSEASKTALTPKAVITSPKESQQRTSENMLGQTRQRPPRLSLASFGEQSKTSNQVPSAVGSAAEKSRNVEELRTSKIMKAGTKKKIAAPKAKRTAEATAKRRPSEEGHGGVKNSLEEKTIKKQLTEGNSKRSSQIPVPQAEILKSPGGTPLATARSPAKPCSRSRTISTSPEKPLLATRTPPKSPEKYFPLEAVEQSLLTAKSFSPGVKQISSKTEIPYSRFLGSPQRAKSPGFVHISGCPCLETGACHTTEGKKVVSCSCALAQRSTPQRN